jgi:hypothetical protein
MNRAAPAAVIFILRQSRRRPAVSFPSEFSHQTGFYVEGMAIFREAA